MKDKVQITVAVLLAVAGLAAFYWLSDKPMIARVGAMFAGFIVAGVVGWFTQPGREFVQYAKESIEETKKVVWPTRKETIQTTAAVFGFILVMAVFLWVSDKSLEWVLYDLILGWKKT